METTHFTIQTTEFRAPVALELDHARLPVRSVPRPYEVSFTMSKPVGEAISAVLDRSNHPLALVDRHVRGLYRSDLSILDTVPTMEVDADESFKSVEGALAVLKFMDNQRMARSSLLVVIGGGIVQDVGAFAACVYKRNVPWAYVPTTLLAQADSCIGAKSGLNFNGAKNLVGVFSAPRHVLVHGRFLETLSTADLLSGLGEVFRLSIIGGSKSLDAFESRLQRAVQRSGSDLSALTQMALSVKRSVIEADEYEIDLRRSMNFGHTVGHAFEAITDHAIPHGTAVAVGVLVESEMSRNRGLLSAADNERITKCAKPLVPLPVRSLLGTLDYSRLLDVLFKDKKAEGAALKLVVPQAIGAIRFVDLPLEQSAVAEVEQAVETVLTKL